MLNENRSLIYTGKLLRQPETGFEWNGWTELFVFLFDNYRKSFDSPVYPRLTNHPIVVMTRPKEKDGVTKYQVYRRASHVRFHVELRTTHLLCSPFYWTFLLYRRPSTWIHRSNEAAGCCLSAVERERTAETKTAVHIMLRELVPTPSMTPEQCIPVQSTTRAGWTTLAPCSQNLPRRGCGGRPSWRMR